MAEVARYMVVYCTDQWPLASSCVFGHRGAPCESFGSGVLVEGANPRL